MDWKIEQIHYNCSLASKGIVDTFSPTRGVSMISILLSPCFCTRYWRQWILSVGRTSSTAQPSIGVKNSQHFLSSWFLYQTDILSSTSLLSGFICFTKSSTFRIFKMHSQLLTWRPRLSKVEAINRVQASQIVSAFCVSLLAFTIENTVSLYSEWLGLICSGEDDTTDTTGLQLISSPYWFCAVKKLWANLLWSLTTQTNWLYLRAQKLTGAAKTTTKEITTIVFIFKGNYNYCCLYQLLNLLYSIRMIVSV